MPAHMAVLLQSFWQPQDTPDSEINPDKPSMDVMCPVTGKKLKLKDLTPVRFTTDPDGPGTSYIDPISKDSLKNSSVLVVLKPTGDVMLEMTYKTCVKPEGAYNGAPSSALSCQNVAARLQGHDKHGHGAQQQPRGCRALGSVHCLADFEASDSMHAFARCLRACGFCFRMSHRRPWARRDHGQREGRHQPCWRRHRLCCEGGTEAAVGANVHARARRRQSGPARPGRRWRLAVWPGVPELKAVQMLGRSRPRGCMAVRLAS